MKMKDPSAKFKLYHKVVDLINEEKLLCDKLLHERPDCSHHGAMTFDYATYDDWLIHDMKIYNGEEGSKEWVNYII